MTRTKHNAKVHIKKEDLQRLLAEDRDLLQVIVEQTVQQILEAEREEALQGGRSERTETRLGYRAGYYQRTLVTRVGKIELRVPQDRQGRFRTEVFERYQRRRLLSPPCWRCMCKECPRAKGRPLPNSCVDTSSVLRPSGPVKTKCGKNIL